MQERKLMKEDVGKALYILLQNDIGKNIVESCQSSNFDVSEIQLVPPDGKRGAMCFRQIDGQEIQDIVSVNENLLEHETFKLITNQDEKCQMLANLLAHELTHAVQYGHNSDLIPVENNKQQNEDVQSNPVEEAIMESLMEADCRAVQFVMALQNQSPAVLKILEKQHMPSNGLPILNKNQYTIWKLKHKADNNADTIKKQQAFREIFSNILTSYVNVYEKYLFPKYGINSKIDFNEHEKLLASIYDERKYGSARQFADIIPNLSDKSKMVLIGAILSRKKTIQHHHTIKISTSEKTKSNYPFNKEISKTLE